MSDGYTIAVAVGGIGSRTGYVIVAERDRRRRTFGPYYIEDGASMAADVWVATYAGIVTACRLKLAHAETRHIGVTLLGAVQALSRTDADADPRPNVAAAARAIAEAKASVRWVRKHECAVMAAAHAELGRIADEVTRQEMFE